ncbi:hypothetical protein CHLRE_17g738800v5 [Chlamydomonas reinhardtii]|uniref:F-box domain-containing protein n=1 Tax=Chlamydomonas reinhardtii TaxID=3055 RepID=A0A2K3CRK9_CHLRE|nr:uncharacterized protein CHLRE_17g738800v5 [Chlamydomonas reinhardtii]PNW70915.1 hypothetical protein CHLRE_17g738800v5 [Chlamydomonas reinhardtii]
MKLRLRTAGTGALYRLDVDPGTWKTLLTEVRQAVGLADDAPVVLSLNKKTPLEPASEDDVLDKLGVCGGDLLWLLSPAPEVSPPAHGSSATNGSSTMNGGSSSNAAPAATTAAAAVAAGGAGSGAAAAAPVAALAPAAAVDSGGTGGGAAAVAGIEGGGGGAAAAGGEDGAEEGPLAPLPVEEGEAEAEAGSGAAAAARRLLPGVPAKLRLLLCAPSPSDPAGSGSGSAAAPAGGAGAATGSASTGGYTGSGSGSGGGSVSGPVLLGALLPPVWRALLVVDAVMAESELQPLQDLPALLSASPAAPPPRQLLYGCSYIGAAAAAAVAATQATEGPPLCGGAGAGEDVTMVEAGGSSSGGCSNSGGSAAAMKLVWYGMGRHLVLHGSPVAAVHSVNAGQPTATTTVTISIDLSEYGTAAPPPGGAATNASTITAAAAAAAAAAGLPAALAAHWRRLKDGLGLPLLAAACRAAGVAAPVGLPALPMELQLAVLKKLKARDLVALGATCSYWHGLAYDDALWRPLYESEFAAAGAAAQSDQQLAAARGWAHVFGRRWQERVEARRRRQQFRPAVPGWGPPPLAPLARPPFMPPGTIGGDYDRLPAIGGGMMLPGGGLPGGLPGGFGFGGGVAGRGGGRFGGGGPGGLGGFGVPRPRQWGGGGMGGGWM